jgi:hypothetical protein
MAAKVVDDSVVNPAAGQINEGFSAVQHEQYVGPAKRSGVAIWDAGLLEKAGELDGASDVFSMALASEQNLLVTAGEEVRTWEFLTREQADEIADPSMALQGIGVGTIVVASVLAFAAGAAFGAPFMAVDPLTATQMLMLPAGLAIRSETCTRSVAVTADGGTVVSTTRGPAHNVMAVFDRASGKVTEKWRAENYVCDMAFSPDGRFLLTATDRGIFLYDTANWNKEKLGNSGGD